MIDRIKLSSLLLIIANLIPVFGVLFWDWDVFVLLLLFWCENVIIGAFGILKMLFGGCGIFLSGFFTVHYGGFMFGHLMILFAMFGDGSDRHASELSVIRDTLLDRSLLLSIIGLVLSHAWSFVNNFLLTEERNLLTASTAMVQPYKRMVITHVALIAGGFFLTKLGQPVVGLLLLMAMKIALDVSFHRREHRLPEV